MIFTTRLGNKRIRVSVNEHQPYFEYRLQDETGKPLPEMAKLVNREIEDRLYEEYRICRDAEYYQA
jgi:hypothetical protein